MNFFVLDRMVGIFALVVNFSVQNYFYFVFLFTQFLVSRDCQKKWLKIGKKTKKLKKKKTTKKK